MIKVLLLEVLKKKKEKNSQFCKCLEKSKEEITFLAKKKPAIRSAVKTLIFHYYAALLADTY